MPNQPISAGHTALIRLVSIPGLDPQECPAIVCCGGRWDVHGAPLARTWGKLGAFVPKGAATVTLAEPVPDWRVGDRVIVTATKRPSREEAVPSVAQAHQTEERFIRAVDGSKITLDRSLEFAHYWDDHLRGEVANLSRNVVIESADPGGVRGHTMYHHNSAGSISYAEFRHLGKRGKLGKYSLHFHRVGDTMRGSSVIGASIWDSANRWITIHGTNDLVVRDCIGYRSIGHGFFLEDGTEVDNILVKNLAVQACRGEPLPGQVFPLDKNDGAGFWWANSQNAFLENVAVECDEYGYRFDASESPGLDLAMSVRGPDGQRRKVDIRTLPFLRFEGNEAHTQRRYGLNLGGAAGRESTGGVNGIGPDSEHPFVIHNLTIWDALWAISPASPGVLIDGLEVIHCDYAFWRVHFDRHAYRRLDLFRTSLPYAHATGERPDESVFPSPLRLVDDRPPVTVVTQVGPAQNGRLVVRGVAADNGTIRSVRVNGQEARPLAPNFLEWETLVDAPHTRSITLTALAEDAAGNIERLPHSTEVSLP
jgi:hypothetical protein